jgi:hypothetical protein
MGEKRNAYRILVGRQKGGTSYELNKIIGHYITKQRQTWQTHPSAPVPTMQPPLGHPSHSLETIWVWCEISLIKRVWSDLSHSGAPAFFLPYLKKHHFIDSFVDQTNILRTVASLKMLRDGPPRIVH